MKDIPTDLAEYLRVAESLTICMSDGEVLKAELIPLSGLRLGRFLVDDEYDNPTAVPTRAEFEGYSLLKDADEYDPNGILIWFTDLHEYGAWDCDHLAIITFPGVTWTDIVANPTWFINGQWYPERVSHRVITPRTKANKSE